MLRNMIDTLINISQNYQLDTCILLSDIETLKLQKPLNTVLSIKAKKYVAGHVAGHVDGHVDGHVILTLCLNSSSTSLASSQRGQGSYRERQLLIIDY